MEKQLNIECVNQGRSQTSTERKKLKSLHFERLCFELDCDCFYQNSNVLQAKILSINFIVSMHCNSKLLESISI